MQVLKIPSQKCGANIRRVFTFTNQTYKIFTIVFCTFAVRKKSCSLMNVLKAYFLLFVSLISFSVTAQLSLCYNFKKGDTFIIKQDINQTITQKITESNQEILNTTSSTIEFKIKEVHADLYTIEVQFRNLELYMNSNQLGELINVKTCSEEENDPHAKMFKSIIDIPITVQMKKNGDIIAVEGTDKLLNNMLSAAQVEDEFTLEIMKASLERDFGPEALAQNYKQMTYFYPEKLVAVNDTWENTYKGDVTANNVWELTALENEEASIIGRSIISMNIYDSGVLMSLKGSQDIELSADINTGILKKMIIESTAQGVSVVDENEEDKIPTTITSKSVYSIIK